MIEILLFVLVAGILIGLYRWLQITDDLRTQLIDRFVMAVLRRDRVQPVLRDIEGYRRASVKRETQEQRKLYAKRRRRKVKQFDQGYLYIALYQDAHIHKAVKIGITQYHPLHRVGWLNNDPKQYAGGHFTLDCWFKVADAYHLEQCTHAILRDTNQWLYSELFSASPEEAVAAVQTAAKDSARGVIIEGPLRVE